MLEKYITPEEAVELWKYQLASEYYLSRKIYFAILGCDMCDPDSREYGGIFHAGYVAGIRAERDKRRRKAADIDPADIRTLARRCHYLIDHAVQTGSGALLLHIIELLENHS